MVLLTRLLTEAEFGLYSIILSFITLLALPFTGGFSLFNMKHTSSYMSEKAFNKIKGLMLFTLLWIAIDGSVLALIAYFGLGFFVEASHLPFYLTGLFIMFLTPFILQSGAFLRGFKHVVIGRVPEYIIQPILFVALIATHIILSDDPLTIAKTLELHLISVAITLIFSLLILFKYLPSGILNSKAKYDVLNWFKSALPLIFFIGMIVVNSHIDILMVGALASEQEAGFYRTASRLAGFIPFFLFATNNAVGPYIASLHSEGKSKQLQKILTMVARLTFFATLPLLFILLIVPNFTLSLLFGSQYGVAATALIILAIANFFNVAMGQVGQVMALTGHEKYTAYAVIISVLCNIGLNYVLVPQYGINGAAIATGASIIIWNALLTYWTQRKTGYVCHIFGKRS